MTPPAARDGELDRIVEFARAHLGMDAAYVAEFVGGRQLCRAVQGDHASFGLLTDDAPLLGEAYWRRVADTDGDGDVVVGTENQLGVEDLQITHPSGIGCYVGVPLRTSDGQIFGTFCCLSHVTDAHLDDRDLRFMQLLADLITERLEASDQLRRARTDIADLITAGRIDMALQPVVSMVDGHWSGVEALARFPTIGQPTDAVIARAHDVGMGRDLELLALQAALEHLRFLPDDVYLSVNIGPVGLLAPGFASIVRRCPAPDRLIVELTEHASVDEYSELTRVLTPLRADGVRLAVDDVGAGYSSLRHILQMRPDVIKVDRSLVHGIAGDAARRTIVTSVVLLSLDLGASLVAEGVETMDDAIALADLGVDDAQGHLFAAPTTDPEVWESWARRRVTRKPGERVGPPGPWRPPQSAAGQRSSSAWR